MKTAILESALNFLVIVAKAIDGRFGNKVLKPKFRIPWQFLTYGILSYLSFILICKFFTWWSGIVDMLNYIIWG